MEKAIMKKLSVIVPVYNVAPYLEQCVDSLLTQSYSNLEIILIDDGSTDGSGILCDNLAVQDDRIVVIHQKNAGVSAARNAGLSAAKGEYIGFVDPDDWCEPDMFAHLIRAIETDGTDGAFCGYWEDFEDNEFPPIEHSPKRTGVASGEEAFYQCMIGIGHGYFTSVWNKCFRRSALTLADHSLSPFPPGHSIGEDELWLLEQYPRWSTISLIPQMYYHWRQHSGSVLHKKGFDRKWYQALATKKEIAGHFSKESPLYDLILGKVYSDLFHCIWFSHCFATAEDEQYFRRELKPYRKYFWKSKEFSVLKKLRFLVLDWMCLAHIPEKWIQKLGDTTRVKLQSKK